MTIVTRSSKIGDGYSASSVNVTIFRRNSLATFGDRQFAAWYDAAGRVMLARRTLGSHAWEIRPSDHVGDAVDAHKSISLMPDGDGYLHVAWDHHNDSLRYARGLEPGGLELGERIDMIGSEEDRLTYPEFHTLPDGDLLFAYRDRTAGGGDLVINRYRTGVRRWERVQSRLLAGERARNPYWQLCTDEAGAVHLSWVWRESADASTNHDMHYARSDDGGASWRTIEGEMLVAPIALDDSAPVWPIAERHNLMNQTSMTVDRHGHPWIATWFRATEDTVTQVHVIHHDGERWRCSRVSDRADDFDLAGIGTRSLPLSRPQIVASHDGASDEGTGDDGSGSMLYVIYRDAACGDRAIIASARAEPEPEWRLDELTERSTGRWEPTFDTELWRRDGALHLFMQVVQQHSDDEPINAAPTPVSVLEVELPIT